MVSANIVLESVKCLLFKALGVGRKKDITWIALSESEFESVMNMCLLFNA